MKTWGGRLKYYRICARMSQRGLGRLLPEKVTQACVSLWESNYTIPATETRQMIAIVLGLPVETIWDPRREEATLAARQAIRNRTAKAAA